MLSDNLKKYLKEIHAFNPKLDPKRTYNEGAFMLAKDFEELSGIAGFQLSEDFLPTIQMVLPWATAASRNGFNLKLFDTFPLFEELDEKEHAAVTILTYSIDEPYDRIYCGQNMDVFEASLILNTLSSAIRKNVKTKKMKNVSDMKPSGMKEKMPRNKSELYNESIPADYNFYHEALRVFNYLDEVDNPEWHK